MPSAAPMPVEAAMRRALSKHRITLLRDIMRNEKLDYYVVPNVDSHGTIGLLAKEDRRVEWLIGFTGTASVVVVDQENVHLILPACGPCLGLQTTEDYRDVSSLDVKVVFLDASHPNSWARSWLFWLSSYSGVGKIGADPFLIPHITRGSDMLSRRPTGTLEPEIDILSRIIFPKDNLIDRLRKTSSRRTNGNIYRLKSASNSGGEALHKLKLIMKGWQSGRKWSLLWGPSDNPCIFLWSIELISRILGLCGDDVPLSSVFCAGLFLEYQNEMTGTLFVDKSRTSDATIAYLRHLRIDVRPYTDVRNFLQYGVGNRLVRITEDLPHAIAELIPQRRVEDIEILRPVIKPSLQRVDNVAITLAKAEIAYWKIATDESWIQSVLIVLGAANVGPSTLYKVLPHVIHDVGDNPAALDFGLFGKHLAMILYECTRPDFKAQPFYELAGSDAQTILLILQDIFDRFALYQSITNLCIEDCIKTRLLYLFLRFARRSGEILPSIYVEGLSNISADYVKCGGFADIFKGTLDSKPVALKRLRLSRQSGNFRKNLLREAMIWRQLHHPYILPFLGVASPVTDNPNDLYMVSPWISRGTLRQAAEAYRAKNWTLRWISQIAEALVYLHQQKIVHGDLRGNNILVNNQDNVQITDFGLSRIVAKTPSEIEESTSVPGGSVRWMAPELLLPKKFGLERSERTEKSDTFAFGCTCIEIFTLKDPFPELISEAVSIPVLNGQHPDRPTDADCGGSHNAIPDAVWDLIIDCLSQDRSRRPQMDNVLNTLATIRTQPPPPPSSQLLVPMPGWNFSW